MPEGDQIDELEDLGMELGTVFQVVSIEKLNDGSWEMVASRVYVPTLAANLTRLYPGCHFDPKYDPFQPAPRDVDYFGIARARELTRQCVLKRAERMVEDSWPIAAACYAFLLQRPLPKPRL